MSDFLPDHTFELSPYAEADFIVKGMGSRAMHTAIPDIDIPDAIGLLPEFPDILSPPSPPSAPSLQPEEPPMSSVGELSERHGTLPDKASGSFVSEAEKRRRIQQRIASLAEDGVVEMAPRQLETGLAPQRAKRASELAVLPPAFTSSTELVTVEHARWDVVGYRQPTAHNRTFDIFWSAESNEASEVLQSFIVGALALITMPMHRIDRKYPSVAPINVHQHMEPLVKYVQALLVERIPQPIRGGDIGQDLQQAILQQAHGAIERIDTEADKRSLIKSVSKFFMPNRATYRNNRATFQAVEAAGKQTLDKIVAYSDKHPAYTALELAKILNMKSAHYRPADESVITSGDELRDVVQSLQKNPDGPVKVHTVKYSEEAGDMMAVIGDERSCVYILYALFGEERLGPDHSKIASIAAIGIEASALKTFNKGKSDSVTRSNSNKDMDDIPDYYGSSPM
jgi:hypothetical protein